MRLSQAIALVGALALLGVGSAAAEPAARAASYKAPIVASLSQDDGEAESAARHASARPGARTRSHELLSSPGAQLATTAAVFVFAMFLASLASKRR